MKIISASKPESFLMEKKEKKFKSKEEDNLFRTIANDKAQSKIDKYGMKF